MLLSGRMLAYHARVLRQFLILEAKKEKRKEKEKVCGLLSRILLLYIVLYI